MDKHFQEPKKSKKDNFLLVNQGLEKIFSVKPKTKQQRASAVLGASLMKSSNQLGILFFIKMKKKMVQGKDL